MSEGEDVGAPEEVAAGGAELTEKRAVTGEAEEAEETVSAAEVEEEEEVAEYHPISPDLVKALLDAVDILVKLASGEITIAEARKLYEEYVRSKAEQLAATAPTKKSSKSSGKKSSKSSKSSRRSRKKKAT